MITTINASGPQKHDEIATILSRIDDNTSLLPLKKVIDRIGYGRSYIYDKLKKGQFPRPIYTGSKKPRWLSFEITQWIADQAKNTRESRTTPLA